MALCSCGGAFDFYPRSPCGERLNCTSIGRPKRLYFYPRSPCGERQRDQLQDSRNSQFLSTLSLRRATTLSVLVCSAGLISIHALLAESDPSVLHNFRPLQISIHALLAESDCLRCCAISCITISIHALLAESDVRLYRLSLVSA